MAVDPPADQARPVDAHIAMQPYESAKEHQDLQVQSADGQETEFEEGYRQAHWQPESEAVKEDQAARGTSE